MNARRKKTSNPLLSSFLPIALAVGSAGWFGYHAKSGPQPVEVSASASGPAITARLVKSGTGDIPADVRQRLERSVPEMGAWVKIQEFVEGKPVTPSHIRVAPRYGVVDPDGRRWPRNVFRGIDGFTYIAVPKGYAKTVPLKLSVFSANGPVAEWEVPTLATPKAHMKRVAAKPNRYGIEAHVNHQNRIVITGDKKYGNLTIQPIAIPYLDLSNHRPIWLGSGEGIIVPIGSMHVVDSILVKVKDTNEELALKVRPPAN